MRVVLAHGSEEARERFGGVLAAVGHEVIVAGSAEEALQRCRDATPDVTVLDVALCRDDGIELLEAIKTDAEAYRTAVILLEHCDLDLDSAVEALRRGVQDFLVEPFADAELLARVEAAGRTTVLQQELMAQAHRLEGLLFEDPLTGLSNRRFILTQLGGMVSAARRHGRPLTAAIVDIDHFKAINDTFGHHAGDEVLATVAGALRHRMRAEDQLGRLGGEEFLALLPDTDADSAAAAVEKLRAAVAGTVTTHEADELAVTVSIGWASWDGDSAEELLRRADEALYAAKEQGRDRAVGGAPASLHRRR
jgi:two-component system cell cycle response regulator